MVSRYGITDKGVAKSVLENKPDSPLAALLLEFVEDVCDQLREGLKKHDVNTSSLGLSQSIQPTKVSLSKGGVSIGITAEHYWKFINYGVNGTEVNHGAPAWGVQPNTGKSFHQEILEWIPKRGVQLPESFDTYNQFAWAIMQSVRKKGKEPKPFYDEVVNDNLTRLIKPKIEKLMGRAIEVAIIAG